MPFKPFSLSDAIKDNQTIQLNRLKLQSLQGEIQRERGLRKIASESVRPTYEDEPVYGRAEGPPTPEGVEPEIQTGTEQIQTGMEYDPEMHQQKLAEVGEIELSANLQKMIGQMDEEEREDTLFKFQGMSRLMAGVKDEETYNERQEQGIQQGFITEEQRQPYSQENVQMIQNLGRKVDDIYGDGRKTGSSEYERLTQKKNTVGLDPDEQSRYEVLGGMKARPSPTPYQTVDVEGEAQVFDKTTGKYIYSKDAKLTGAETRSLRTTKDKQAARYEKKTTSLRKDAAEGTSHFNKQRVAVNDAIAALEAGNNALADTMVTQIMSQVVDSKVRAFQMYSVFDRTYGNVANRTFKALSQFVTGERTDEDRQTIKDTLLRFKKYSDPAAKLMRNKYRAIAKDDDLDPFRVVPPDSPEDIRDSHVPLAEKKRLLKLFYPEMFAK